jgi:hypothetical protein
MDYIPHHSLDSTPHHTHTAQYSKKLVVNINKSRRVPLLLLFVDFKKGKRHGIQAGVK